VETLALTHFEAQVKLRTERVLLFVPEAEFIDSYGLELAISQLVASDDGEVIVIGCARDLLPMCPVMTAWGADPNTPQSVRKSVCRTCSLSRKRAMVSFPSFAWKVLAEFAEESDDRLINAFVDKTDGNNYLQREFHNLPVGQLATYLPLLTHKVHSVTENAQVWDFYREELRNIIRITLLAERFLARLTPTKVLTPNHLYGTHRVVLMLARNQGIETWGVSPGFLMPKRTDSALLLPGEKSSQTMAESRTIRSGLDIPVRDGELSLVEGNLMSLIEASDPWVYSPQSLRLPPAEVRRRLGVRPTNPVVTVLLSSPDETTAAVTAGADYRVGSLAGQVTTETFLERVLECAASLPDFDFVMRLHPRMVPNKREKIMSPALDNILALLKECPENVVVADPRQGFSLYDNVLISSAALNHTSSSGLEFMAFGVPALHLDDLRLGAYPGQLGVRAPDSSELSSFLTSVVARGWHPELIQGVYRWWATILTRIAVFPFEAPGGQSLIDPSSPNTRRPLSVVSSLFRLLPEDGRRSIQQVQARRQRRKHVFRAPARTATAEVSASLRASRDQVIWNPELILRGGELANEESAVLAVVRSAASSLGWMSLSEGERVGMGCVQELLLREENSAHEDMA